MVGNEPFMYSSDFPHEVNAATCKKELDELIENGELSDADKGRDLVSERDPILWSSGLERARIKNAEKRAYAIHALTKFRAKHAAPRCYFAAKTRKY